MNKIDFAIRAFLGAVFLYAGIIKAGASEQFALALVPFTFVPIGWLGTLAIALPLAEIAAGILILLPRVHMAGSVLICLLSLTFIGTLSWALSNGIIVACGCFGADETPSAFKMLIAIARDIVFFLLAAATIAHRSAAAPAMPHQPQK